MSENENALTVGSYGTNAQAGFDDMDRAELAIPYIVLLQALSPQVNGEDAIDGAKAGCLFNTLTEEVIPGPVGLHCVPLVRQHVFVEYAAREAGGGLVARRQPGDNLVRQLRAEQGRFGKLKTPAGNELVETFYLYVGLLEDPQDTVFSGLALISFTSTKIKKYQNIITRLRSNRIVLADGSTESPPLFANRIHITTVQEKNNHGTFANFKIQPSFGTLSDSLVAADSPLIAQAERFIADLSDGTAVESTEEETPF